MSAGDAWGQVLAVFIYLVGALAAAFIVYLIIALVKLMISTVRGETRLGTEQKSTVFRSGKDDR